jgi:hypothetical protein
MVNLPEIFIINEHCDTLNLLNLNEMYTIFTLENHMLNKLKF